MSTPPSRPRPVRFGPVHIAGAEPRVKHGAAPRFGGRLAWTVRGGLNLDRTGGGDTREGRGHGRGRRGARCSRDGGVRSAGGAIDGAPVGGVRRVARHLAGDRCRAAHARRVVVPPPGDVTGAIPDPGGPALGRPRAGRVLPARPSGVEAGERDRSLLVAILGLFVLMGVVLVPVLCQGFSEIKRSV